MLRVLHVVPRLNHGGVEKALLDLACIWKDYDLGPFFVVSHGGTLSPLFKKHGATLIEAPVHTKNPFLILLNIFKLRRIVREHGIHLIHVHSRAPAWSVAGVRSVPFVATYHGAYRALSPLKTFYNSVMLRGKYVIAVSKFIENHLKNLESKAKIALIPQGINTSYFSKKNQIRCKKLENISLQYPLILCPGRLSWTKGQDVLLKALRFLPENLSVVFLGDGHKKYQSQLKRLASEAPQKIHFLPSVSDMRPWYGAAYMVVAPSLVPEAFGRICLESMAMEVPFVGTSHGATKEVSGGTSFLTPPNHPKALAQAIWTILNLSKEDKETLVEQARLRAETAFSLDTTMRSLKSVYEACLSSKEEGFLKM